MGEEGEDVKPKLNISVEHEGQSMSIFHIPRENPFISLF